jgi:uncharacterized membrane protein
MISLTMIKNILVLGLIILIVDSGYLYLLKDILSKLVLTVQNSKMEINVLYAFMCYVFLVLALYYFIIRRNAPIQDAFILGACIYGVFETTNLAILKKWNPMIAAIDVIWGGILFVIVTSIWRQIF